MNVWDWHYRIYFDDVLRQRVIEFAQTLKPEEKDICLETVAFYSSFYSFGIMLDQILEKPERCDWVLSIAKTHTDQLIRTPDLLIAPYRKKVKNAVLSQWQKRQLLDLLEVSKSGKEIRKEFWDYLRNLLGESTDKLFAVLSDERYSQYVRLPRQKVVQENHQSIFDFFFSDLKQNPELSARFGSCAIETFDMEIKEGTAYGEWWDRELSCAQKDKLILFTSDVKVKRDDYLYTILHETYPGHGHFYNYVRNAATAMDHGANMLVEGWATFCEWAALPTPYTQAVRHNGIAFLHNSYNRSINELSQVLWENKKKMRVSFKKALPSLILSTQYVGFMESYYLGALWLEEMICIRGLFTPKEFLDKVKSGNKGEFFRLWQ